MIKFDYSRTIADTCKGNRRYGIQGAPGSGKTYGIVHTFPNLIIADMDNKLGLHIDNPNVQVLPFHRNDFCKQLSEIKGFGVAYDTESKNNKEPGRVVNRALLFAKWIKTEATKIEPDQNLLVDSWSLIVNNFAEVTNVTPKMEDGHISTWDAYRRLQLFSTKLLDSFKSLECNLIVTFHETRERNLMGDLTSKVEPLMEGKVKDQLQGHFTDWYRQISRTKMEDGKPVLDSRGKPLTEWLWQLKSDSIVECSCSIKHLQGIQFIPSDYKYLVDPSLVEQLK